MTEAQWLNSRESLPMLNLIEARASARKLRLFSCGCCRQLDSLPNSRWATTAVEVTELYADDLSSVEELRAICEAANSHDGLDFTLCLPERFRIWAAASTNCATQADLLRDVIGNPFRHVTFVPAWRTTTVLALSQQMYGSRDFSAMPILADALADAGCDDEAVLSHCRGPGPHIRGCWVTDSCLEKV